MTTIATLDIYNLYRQSWQNELTPEAFVHPAKYSRGLIRWIYRHMMDNGWLRPGAVVLDPFAGVACGALDAMKHGLHYRGVELESRFITLAQQNIALWNGRYAAHIPGWGTAEIYQGDSRRLVEVLQAAGGVVSSPPYAQSIHTGKNDDSARQRKAEKYKRGEFQTVRPDVLVSEKNIGARAMFDSNYGNSPGQLAAMPEGSPAVISSPPYVDAIHNGEGPGVSGERFARYRPSENAHKNDGEYGATAGQLGAMRPGMVSSPPFQDMQGTGSGHLEARLGRTDTKGEYGSTNGQLGNNIGDTFWTAAATIIAQCHQVLVPGSVAAWVCKRYVRDGRIVEFSQQWADLCYSLGFRPLEWVRAWLTEDRGTQLDIFGNGHQKIVKRASFFRRLHERRNPHLAIDWEDAIFMERV